MKIKDFIAQYDWQKGDLVISNVGSSIDVAVWRNESYDGDWVGMIRIVKGSLIILEKKQDNEPRKAGLFQRPTHLNDASCLNQAIPSSAYPEWNPAKHVVYDRKRDFIERAAIAAMQGLLSGNLPNAKPKNAKALGDAVIGGASMLASGLWSELQKESDDGK